MTVIFSKKNDIQKETHDFKLVVSSQRQCQTTNMATFDTNNVIRPGYGKRSMIE